MTATAYQTPAPLVRYLRRATLGLPPERREEVWNELEEHVLCRAERLEWTGLTPDKALAQALRELGPPLRVSAAMNGVHNMPKMIAFGTLGLLAVSAGLYALAQQPLPTREVNFRTEGPKQTCVKTTEPQPHLPLLAKYPHLNCYQDDSQTQAGTYISLSELQKFLPPVGMTAAVNSDKNKIEFKVMDKEVASVWVSFNRDGEAYVDAGDLMELLMFGYPVTVQVHSYFKPTFNLNKIGNVTPSVQGEVASQQLYQTIAKAAAYKMFDFSGQGKYWGYDFVQPEPTVAEQTLHTAFEPDEVVAAFQYSAVRSKSLPRTLCKKWFEIVTEQNAGCQHMKSDQGRRESFQIATQATKS